MVNKKELIKSLQENNIIEQLEEQGKINIDFIDGDLDLLIEVLESEFDIRTEIQNLVGGQYLVRIGE